MGLRAALVVVVALGVAGCGGAARHDRTTAQPDDAAVTYCPLCNSAIVFDRRVGGRTPTFGTTGKLRRSDLVMWDRQTQSWWWWQQFTGEALVGRYTGARLRPLDSQTLSFAQFKARYPRGAVLSRDTGFDRRYGENPYVGYDAPGERPFRFDGRPDARLPPKERSSRCSLRARRSWWRSRGCAAIRSPRRALTFRAARGGRFTDAQTGSTWDSTGRAIAGPLRGRSLRPLRHDEQSWFALAAFVPQARLVR